MNHSPNSAEIDKSSQDILRRSDTESGAALSSFDPTLADISAIAKSMREQGLFDEQYYLANHLDVAASQVDPFEHFYRFGYREGRLPNPYFDPKWYLQTYPDVQQADFQPLLHYVLQGEKNGYSPCPHFDPSWYRKRYELSDEQNALAHYLRHRFGPFSPIPEFDSNYYLETYRDVATAGVDPFEHYLHVGYREGRNPSNAFDTRFYVQRYFKGKATQNPLIHYIQNRADPRFLPLPPEAEATIPSQVKRFTKPGVHFEEFRTLATRPPKAKLLAYYLTQFHTFPENDKWWGTGFTEWTNVARGLPRFAEHYQPRIPRDLGFYTLENIETMRRQVELAVAAGIGGFVFYYYWFNRKRLLDRPLEQFLATPDINMPFCLMWANENWTRRWDGLEGEVLISQEYRTEDDVALVEDFARHFSDRRYIRVQGRPLLMIYRPGLIPNAADVVERWRSIFAERFGENPLIVMGQSFDDYDPRKYGMDGAIEFPPHKVTKDIPLANADTTFLDETFSGQIFNYDDVSRHSVDEAVPEFPLIKTVVPSWDNDARRQGTGLVIHGSTPLKYENWLATLVDKAQRNPFFGEPIVCVNAWNEWCEGAYLEPDVHFGGAYLNATSRAIRGLTRTLATPRLLLVGHDAFPSGAQQLLLNIGRRLRSAFGFEIEFLLLNGGKMESDYAAVAPLSVVRDPNAFTEKVQDLRLRGFTAALINTSAAAHCVPNLSSAGMSTLLLIHELPRILREKRLMESAKAGIAAAQHVIFPAGSVCKKVIECLNIQDSDQLLIRPQGTYKTINVAPKKAAALRSELKIPEDAFVVLGAGYADMRKGFDLFLQVWRILTSESPKFHFVWVGGIDPALRDWLADEISDAEKAGTFHMAGFRSDMDGCFTAAGAFVLTSREDPFPAVVLEAMSIGVPVIAFADSGGIPEFLTETGAGQVVPYCDAPAMAHALKKMAVTGTRPDERLAAARTIKGQFGMTPYVRDLVKLMLPDLPSVSVVVPNYNYAHCLTERLLSIFEQTHPVEEVVVLDDASTDQSISVIKDVAKAKDRDVTIIANSTNSGSVFKQWSKAADIAQGDFIWIAEADDLADPGLLAQLLSLMQDDPTIQFAFCDSKSIDADGAPVYPTYKPYYETLEPSALTQTQVFGGPEFVTRFLSVKNVILNVSSVVWRREALVRALAGCRSELSQFKMAGDWRLYIQSLMSPDAKIAYVTDPLNVHRRHSKSVTHSLDARQHLNEIARVHKAVRREFLLSPEKRVAQAKYLAELSEQLHVDPLPLRADGPPERMLRSAQI